MDVTSVLPVWAIGMFAKLFQWLGGSPSTLADLTIHLWTAGPGVITPSWAIADFTEAAFTGYAAQVATLVTAPVNLENGTGQAALYNALFTCTAAPTSPGISVLGYYVTQGATPIPWLAEKFPTPVPIINVGDYCNLALYLPFLFENQCP